MPPFSPGTLAFARSRDVVEAAKSMAWKALALGPEPLDERALPSRRLTVTGLAAALQPDRDRYAMLGASASLDAAPADL